jgi:peptide/nickel transport system ATP-binding protein
MAGHSRPQDGVASARLCSAIHSLRKSLSKLMDTRVKPAYDGFAIEDSFLPVIP